MIARALRVSLRYLHACFEPAGVSLMAFVLRMRLERCHAELARADERRRSISEIAFAWGFSDLSHFGRAFIAAYGMTPRDWRAASAR
jgi:AraC-like DNA-binding protein